MRTNMDFAPYRGSTVGFDRLFDLFESGFSNQVAETYPPFDLVQDGDDRYHITMVLAGFRPDEVEITAHQNVLIVSGRKQENEDSRYIHRGIAARDFERRFGLADYVKVRNAELKDGMLSIELAREVPEEMKPRRIQISGGGDNARRIEGKSGQTSQAEPEHFETT